MRCRHAELVEDINFYSTLNYLRSPKINSKHPLPTTQEKTLHMEITRWSIPTQIDYILSSQR